MLARIAWREGIDPLRLPKPSWRIVPLGTFLARQAYRLFVRMAQKETSG